MPAQSSSVVAFDGFALIARGPLVDVALAAKRRLDRPHSGPVLLFDASTSAPVEVDFRGTEDDVRARLATVGEMALPAARPGRPRLGVVAREVTLLPRHWEWLAQQRGGASAVLRRLVDHAARTESRGGAVGRARDVTFRFMSQLAGDLPGFESAVRALYAGNHAGFASEIASWPGDVRDHATMLAVAAFD